MAKYKSFEHMASVYSDTVDCMKGSDESWNEAKQKAGIECEHDKREPMTWEQSNGVVKVGLFCSACGHKQSNGVKNSNYDMENIPFTDGKLWKESLSFFNDCKTSVYNEQQARRKNGDTDWMKNHGDYCKTQKWKNKRVAVLKRDSFLCQACLTRKATQVHHLTYKHYMAEPLFDLVSVCDICHRKITEIDRAIP